MKGTPLLLLVALAHSLAAASAASWFDQVSPIMTASERKEYRALEPNAREQFQNDFWAGKSIAPEEYYRRLSYVDANFGSAKLASGANTDPGRVYLSLGAPNRIVQLPSSRIFVLLEIWYYERAPAIGLETELRLIFYRKDALGLPKLYSPTLDTIRALFLPQTATSKAFGPNDDITEAKLRTTLSLSPAEDEVVSAAVSVASGIRGTGNDEILSLALSPEQSLRHGDRTRVHSRLLTSHPPMVQLQSRSPIGGVTVDFRWSVAVRSELALMVRQGNVTVFQDRLHVSFPERTSVEYQHRLDLLPGSYTILLLTDGQTTPYPLEVGVDPAASLVRVNRTALVEARHTPFEFAEGPDRFQLDLDPDGDCAALLLPHPGEVTWFIRQGSAVISKSTSTGERVALLSLAHLAPGSYTIDADAAGRSYHLPLSIANPGPNVSSAPVLSYNANLAPAMRAATIGHQWILRGNLAEARRSLQSSLQQGGTDQATIELARVDALAGNLDQARSAVRAVLARHPADFDALTVLAYIEARFHDYTVAGDLYRRALAVQDSPDLRIALAKLPPAQ